MICGIVWHGMRFPDVGNRSRIVITTRLENVGKKVKYHTDPYSLPFLTTEESCKLLQKKVFQKEDCPPELQDVSQAVAEKCKGLPLVVVLVAGIIKKRKMEESCRNEVKDSLFDYLDCESEEYSRATMQLSFDNLVDCLKPCLLYMGMFPKDARIPVSKLISLWIAEDFVVNIESAEDYLMGLISRNVVMVSKKGYNGKVKYCQVHDVVLHFCSEKSREEKFMLAVKGNLSQFLPCDWKKSRVSFILSKENSKFASLGFKTQKPFHHPLRSLMTIGKSSDEIPLRSWIHKLRLLKVLDLRSHEVYYFSSATLKPLNHLKYLAVWAETFYFHPESDLPHLETLIANTWRKLVLLPASFGEMEKLRHVEIDIAKFAKQGLFERSSKLENLRILKNIGGLPIDDVDVLSRRCPNLQQLDLYFSINEAADSFCLTLENLTQLQILRVSFERPNIVSGLQSSDRIPFSSWIHKLRLLKVLDSSSHEVCYLSSATLKPLNHLKYLAVWAKKFYFHPESHLPHLETLIVNNYVSFMLPASFWEMEKLRHVEIREAEFDKQGLFEGSSKLENLRILKNIVGFPIDRVDVLSRRCPNLQQLHIEFHRGDSDSAESFCLTLENLTQLQILCVSFERLHIVCGLQLPSNLKKLVLIGTDIGNLISFIAGLPSLEYLKLKDPYFPQSEVWCLGDIKFHKLKLLKLVKLKISTWDASEESFPQLETLVIKRCHHLKEIPLSFADIPTLKQIKLIRCQNESLKDSAAEIKKAVEENEGNDRIDLIIKNY